MQSSVHGIGSWQEQERDQLHSDRISAEFNEQNDAQNNQPALSTEHS
jgi:hypothetical protein